MGRPQPDASAQLRAAMEGIEQLRDVMRGMVASLVSDGFTDEQAREIVTGVLRSANK